MQEKLFTTKAVITVKEKNDNSISFCLEEDGVETTVLVNRLLKTRVYSKQTYICSKDQNVVLEHDLFIVIREEAYTHLGLNVNKHTINFELPTEEKNFPLTTNY